MDKEVIPEIIQHGGVLIVDDSRMVRKALAHMLQGTGFNLYEAGTGEEACQQAFSVFPNLILLDITLPDMNGYEVFERIKENPKTRKTPVVFITQLSDEKEYIRGLRLGAVDYITKPVKKEILLEKVHTFVQLNRDARNLEYMHEQLLASNAEFELLEQAIDSVTDSMVLTSLKGEIFHVNKAFSRITGYIKRKNSDPSFIHNHFTSPRKIGDLQFNATMGIAANAETFLKGVAMNIPVDVKCSLILSPEGNPKELVFLITNLTDIKKAEAERQRLETELYHSQKLESVGQLASGIAHEINTPTQFINDNLSFVIDSFPGILQLQRACDLLLTSLKKSETDPDLVEGVEALLEDADIDFITKEIPEALTQSKDGAQRIANIVRAMREFAHPGNVEKTPANLNSAIETTITVTHNYWKYVADLETDMDEDLPLVPCLLSEFNQVILNLITNASDAIAEHTEEGALGKIIITTRQKGEMAEIRIQDTGGGIPEEYQDQVFNPFFTTKEVGAGSGQGLPIARNIVINKHAGNLWFETEPDVGTTFIIQLPLEHTEID